MIYNTFQHGLFKDSLIEYIGRNGLIKFPINIYVQIEARITPSVIVKKNCLCAILFVYIQIRMYGKAIPCKHLACFRRLLFTFGSQTEEVEEGT